MSPDQQHIAFVNKTAELLDALKKQEETNSSIYSSKAKELRRQLHILVVQSRMPQPVAPAKASKTKPVFNHRYSHLAR
jgi:hypothetical protein